MAFDLTDEELQATREMNKTAWKSEIDKWSKEYKTILNKYYVSEDEKATLKEELCLIRRKYKVLKQSCEKSKDVI